MLSNYLKGQKSRKYKLEGCKGKIEEECFHENVQCVIVKNQNLSRSKEQNGS